MTPGSLGQQSEKQASWPAKEGREATTGSSAGRGWAETSGFPEHWAFVSPADQTVVSAKTPSACVAPC